MKDLCEISRYAGMREDLVQAGGGNSAFKIAPEKMAIKASGYQLADITETDGFALVNPQIVREAFLKRDSLKEMTDEESKIILERAYISGARPSIETFLHSIAGRFSLHTHPVVVNAIACRKEGSNIFNQLFPNALIVPYATPGVELAKAYFNAYKKYKENNDEDPSIVFLMNHGLLVSAETAEEVVTLMEKVTNILEEYLNVDFKSYHYMKNLIKLYDDGILWRVSDENVLNAYRKYKGTWNTSICPDCVVFLGKKMYSIENNIDRNDFEHFVLNNGFPVILEYMVNLYIHASSVRKALEIQSVLSFSAQVTLLNSNIEVSLLTEDEKNFLLNWDAEKYRREIK